jgi:hypothetical protein
MKAMNKKYKINNIKKFKVLNILIFINNIKRKIKWLALLNPNMLFITYFILLFIPYVPNISLYLILMNSRINKWVKKICLIISIAFMLLFNIFIFYFIFK